MQKAQETDILIIGGGLVGASLALALNAGKDTHTPLNITLVESAEVSSTSQPSFDDRSTVLSKSSASLFTDIGIWSELQPYLAPIEHIHTSEQGRFGLSRLHAEEYQLDAMGYVVDNRSLGQVLYRKLAHYHNVQQIIPATVESIVAKENYYECHVLHKEKASPKSQQDVLDQTPVKQTHLEQCYRAKLVVICDGGRSSIASQLGLNENVKAYQQAALIANIELDQPHNGWAYERFTTDGPIAMLPLTQHIESDHKRSQHRAALVWTTPTSELEQRLAATNERFLEQLQAEFGYRLGRFRQVGTRAYYPLKVQKVEELIRSRLAVLGNAAHTLHPVAGQGFNLALRGAFLLASTVLQAHKQGKDIGAYSVLKDYEKAQIIDRDRIQQASHRLISIFGNQSTCVGLGRNLAMLALDNCPLAKAGFANAAMGLNVAKPNFRSL